MLGTLGDGDGLELLAGALLPGLDDARGDLRAGSGEGEGELHGLAVGEAGVLDRERAAALLVDGVEVDVGL